MRVHDFGGDGPLLHLAPANGFPPATYRQLAARLTGRFHVIALLPRPLWPGSRPGDAPTWHDLADDLIHGLDALNARGIVGIGHSIGGVLTYWAAVRRPDLFRGVVLMDPVILPARWLWMLRLGRALGISQGRPLVQGALHRRRTWPSRAACFDHYRLKPLFGRWTDAALWDYVEGGTRPLDDGQVELIYPPEWEAHIFGTVPTDVWRDVPRLRIPALVLRGERSNTFRREAQARMARELPRARFATIGDAGHLFPMEMPAETAAAIACDPDF